MRSWRQKKRTGESRVLIHVCSLLGVVVAHLLKSHIDLASKSLCLFCDLNTPMPLHINALMPSVVSPRAFWRLPPECIDV